MTKTASFLLEVRQGKAIRPLHPAALDITRKLVAAGKRLGIELVGYMLYMPDKYFRLSAHRMR